MGFRHIFESLKLSDIWIVFYQYIIENQIKTKHVEISYISCLDPSSILGDSTNKFPKIRLIFGNLY